MSATVTVEPAADVWLPRIGMTSVACRLSYVAADPYAVTLAVGGRGARPATWTFARSLLVAGVVDRAGEGDVRIWRVRSHAPEGLVAYALRNLAGTLYLYVPLAPLMQFLNATAGLALRNATSVSDGVDAELESLLGELDR